MIGNVGGARPQYYDRTPVAVTKDYNSVPVAPHGFTSRWTYTVPTGKKAYVQGMLAMVRRVTAAAPALRLESVILYFPVSGDTPGMCSALTYGNAVDAGDTTAMPGAVLMEAGGILNAQTADTSTDGTSFLRASADILEFDA